MRILFLNWRDKKNPIAGGAEVLTHEAARRWVAMGHEVTLLTSRFPGCLERETVDGVRIIRVGSPWTVYWNAYRTYQREFQGRVDLVVDEVNTLPFFTPWYVQEPILMHFNQLAKEVWLYECPWPISWVGYLLEPFWLKIYRRSQAVAISRSSRHDLLRLGFDQHKVAVMPMPTRPYQSGKASPKEESPTLLFVGRLKRSKRVDHTIQALALLRHRWSRMKLWIVGSGDAAYQKQMQRQVRRLGLEECVTFFGQVSEEKKQQLMQSAHVILVPSVREGWGLIVSEAYSKHTPAVVYPVAGLVDSADHQITGLVARRTTPQALAAEVIELLENKSLWNRLTQPITAATIPVSWEDTADAYLKIAERVAGKEQGLRSAPSLSIVIPENIWSGRKSSALDNIAELSKSYAAPLQIIIVGKGEGSVLAKVLIEAGTAASFIKTISRNPFRNPLYDVLWAGTRESEEFKSELLLYVEPNLGLPSHELESLIKRWQEFPADIVVASRRHSKTWKLKPLLSRFLSNVYHAFVHRLFFMDAGDAQTGVKLFRTKTLKQVLPRLVLKEYALDLEVLAVAHHLGYQIHIEPITVDSNLPQRRAYVLDIFHLVMDTLSIWYRMRLLGYYNRPQIPLSKHPTVSIVIPCVKANPYLTECLEGCQKLDYPADKIQTIVLPNESATLPFQNVTVIPTGPCGPGKKRDLALRHCTGEIVAFIDDDTTPETDWLKNAMRCFADDRIAAVGGPAVTPATDSLRQAASGAVYSSWLVAGNQNYRYAPAPGRWVDDYPSCNLFIRRTVLQQAGGFNTAYWPGEDTILCTKITHELGQKIWYDPDVIVYHHRRAMFGGHLVQIRRYAEHRGFFVKKYPSTSLRLRYFTPSALTAFWVAGAVAALFFQQWRVLYLMLLIAYLLAALIWGMLSLNVRMALLVSMGIVVSHWTYGVYFIKGLLSQKMEETAR